MNISHPYFFYQLQFLVIKPRTQNLISQIEECVLQRNNTSSGIHSMGGRGFYFQKKEFAHIHWNGDLDIFFGKGLTAELLKQNLVQEHKFVPNVAITFHLSGTADLPFALYLMRLSYLKTFKKESKEADKLYFLETELNKLPFNAAITELVRSL